MRWDCILYSVYFTGHILKISVTQNYDTTILIFYQRPYIYIYRYRFRCGAGIRLLTPRRIDWKRAHKTDCKRLREISVAVVERDSDEKRAAASSGARSKCSLRTSKTCLSKKRPTGTSTGARPNWRGNYGKKKMKKKTNLRVGFICTKLLYGLS